MNVSKAETPLFRADAESARRPPRIVLYSHDTLGYGHLRRNMLLAGALKRCACAPDILLIAGMREAGAFVMPPGVDCVSLPAYAKTEAGEYTARDMSTGLDGLRRIRAATIRAAVESFAPDLMLVDNVPRGAQYELDPTLKALRKKARTRIILGLRDVIDDPATTRRQWLRQRNFEALRDFYEGVWIYGDPGLYDTAREYGIETASPIAFTGYLDQRGRLGAPAAQEAYVDLVGEDPRPYVLCSVGGGRDGSALCDAFARAPMPASHRGILITGGQMSAAHKRRIESIAAARDDLTVVEFVPEPIAVAAHAAAIVGMGGYNTTTEMLSLDRPALIVPRVRPRLEQLLRAERLAQRGFLDMMHPDTLTPAGLGSWMAGAVTRQAPNRSGLDMGGLRRVRALADAALDGRDAELRKSA
ncbi:glycosyltransferase family protein [Roseovarius tibetensis]|uniref:glycosyltransferase family protein n=1 Tax=Roseovarius tibetensis TaxID=2685897 RepID=UPI003D7F8146